jgi:hypothetical protein
MSFIFPSHRWDEPESDEILYRFSFDLFSKFSMQTFDHPTIQVFVFIIVTTANVLPQLILFGITVAYTLKLITLKHINGPLELQFAIVYNYLALLRYAIFLPSLTSLLMWPIQGSIYQIAVLLINSALGNFLLRKITFN